MCDPHNTPDLLDHILESGCKNIVLNEHPLEVETKIRQKLCYFNSSDKFSNLMVSRYDNWNSPNGYVKGLLTCIYCILDTDEMTINKYLDEAVH